jgi:hypothetical protein
MYTAKQARTGVRRARPGSLLATLTGRRAGRRDATDGQVAQAPRNA